MPMVSKVIACCLFTQVSLFAELFNEMLMRDFGFRIYKALLAAPEKKEEKKDEKDKKDKKEDDKKKEEKDKDEEKEEEKEEKSEVGQQGILGCYIENFLLGVLVTGFFNQFDWRNQ